MTISRQKADRAGIIIICDNAILLMHRNKQGKAFYCIPGGHMEAGETPEQAALREVEEETTLTIQSPLKLFFQLENEGRQEFYFLAHALSQDTAVLSGEELERNCTDNSYNLVWFPINNLASITLYPEALHKKLCAVLEL